MDSTNQKRLPPNAHAHRDVFQARLPWEEMAKLNKGNIIIITETQFAIQSQVSSNAARRYDDGCHVSRPLLFVACSFVAQDADATTACSSAVSTHVGVL